MQSEFQDRAQGKGIAIRLNAGKGLPDLSDASATCLKTILETLLNAFIEFPDPIDIQITCFYKEGELLLNIVDSGIMDLSQKQVQVQNSGTLGGRGQTAPLKRFQKQLTRARAIAETCGGYVLEQIATSPAKNITVGFPVQTNTGPAEKNFSGEAMIQRWLKDFGADEEIFTIAYKSLTELSGALTEIKALLADGERAKLKKKVHTMKGFPGGFGLIEIYDLLLELETFVHCKVLPEQIISEHLGKIQKILQTLPDEQEIKERYFGSVAKQSQNSVNEDLGEGGTRVLIAEDNQMNQELIVYFLKQMKLDFQVVDNGQKALTVLRQEAFNLVLLDIQMPVMDGIEVARIIRSDPQLCHIPIIGISAYFDDKRDDITKLGYFDDYLGKPIEFEEMVQKIQQQIEGSGFYN